MTEKKKSQADLMVELALSKDIQLFIDQYSQPHIYYPEFENPNFTYGIRNLSASPVKHWLAGLLYKEYEKAPGGEATNSALNVLKAKAREGPQLVLYNRIAPGDDGDIWIDMGAPTDLAIHVTKSGWKINNPPLLFRRYSHQKALPKPLKNGDVSEILKFANLRNEHHKILYQIVTTSFFIPTIPHPIIIAHGSHGSGKSMAMKVIRAVVDPSIVELLALPRNDKELAQQLHHHQLAFYDNVSRLPDWASDVFCRAVTGTGITKRQLYTDDDDIIYQFLRCCAINGINITANKGDLLDRSIILGFDIIENRDRIEQSKLDEQLEEAAPKILGGILDVLVQTLNLYPQVKLDGLYRMADFTRYGYAIAEAMGIGGPTFLEAYQKNVEDQSYETIKASLVATVLFKFLEEKTDGTWRGAPTELYLRLIEQAEELKISTRQKAWPKTAYWMSRRINEVCQSLLSLGVHIESDHTGKQRLISINCSGIDLKTGVNGVNGVKETNAINAINTTFETFSKPGGLVEDLDKVLNHLRKAVKVGEGRVKDKDFYRFMEVEGCNKNNLDKILKILKRDGLVFEPSPGYLGVTT